MAIDIEICSAALVRVGAEPITTLQGAEATNTACRSLYPSVRRDLLSGYRWRFATKWATLERLTDEPLAEFNAAYQLPPNVETVWAVKIADRLVQFDRSEQWVLLDASISDDVVAEVGFIPDEYYWPGYFRTLVEYQLAAALAVPVAEDTQKANYYEGKAMRQYGQARTLDSQTRGARKIEMGGLRRYHRGSA